MQTHFSPQQLLQPNIAIANEELRKCVHCGLCTATCPTYVELGDDCDSPRGRIYQIKSWLEKANPITHNFVKHIDRCLSCLSCMTTCPSGVNYRRLIDMARHEITLQYRRPMHQRIIRWGLLHILPNPQYLRVLLFFGQIFAFFSQFIPKKFIPQNLRNILALIPKKIYPAMPMNIPMNIPMDNFINQEKSQKLVVFHRPCAGAPIRPQIDIASVSVLKKLGFNVVVLNENQCCGALSAHLGYEEVGKAQAQALALQLSNFHYDYIVSSASGCGSFIQDYAHLSPEYQEIADKYRDLSQLINIDEIKINPEFTKQASQQICAYHSACSLQHGLKITDNPKIILEKLGYKVVSPKESHLCCGSAGSYNILQGDIAQKLKLRKIANLENTKPDLIVMGNIGCIQQIASGTTIAIYHFAEIMDKALI